MDEQKYVIAIALAEQKNKRLMPLGGKTFSGVDTLSQSSKKEVEKIILDLLLRLFQRTTEGSLKISNDETGLLLAEISFERQVIDDKISIGYGLAIGDVDGDKKPDILLADKSQVCLLYTSDAADE